VSAGRAHWSHFSYSPLNTRVSAGRVQLVTLLLLSTHHRWISWQSIAGHTSVTLLSSPMDQLAEHSWLHFCYSPFITRGTAGRAQLVILRLLSTHHPCVSWQSTAGHTSVTIHSSPVDQLAEHTGHTSVTLHSSPVDQLAEHTGHTSITLHSSPVDQLAEHSWSHFCCSPLIARVSTGRAHWSHFCYSPLIIRGSSGRAQLFTLLLLSTHHTWISWQSTAGHTYVTLHSSPVDQLAEHSWSHFCYSPLITGGSAGRAQLVTLLLLSTHHSWVSLLSTVDYTSATLHS
jgi:hypothetical protein